MNVSIFSGSALNCLIFWTSIAVLPSIQWQWHTIYMWVCMRGGVSVYSWTRSWAVIESNTSWAHFFDVDDGHPPIYYYLEWFYLLNTLTLTKINIFILLYIARNNDNVAHYDYVFNRIRYSDIHGKKRDSILQLDALKWELCTMLTYI